MRRLIDAEVLKSKIATCITVESRGKNIYENLVRFVLETVRDVIDAQPTIDAVPLDGSFLKMSKGDYLIYNRHWLYEHFDQEMDIQRSVMKSMGYEPALKDAVPVSELHEVEKERDYWMDKAHSYEQTILRLTNSAGEVPVRHGMWIHKGGGIFICDKCNWHIGLNVYTGEKASESFRFCPQCGARMDKE